MPENKLDGGVVHDDWIVSGNLCSFPQCSFPEHRRRVGRRRLALPRSILARWPKTVRLPRLPTGILQGVCGTDSRGYATPDAYRNRHTGYWHEKGRNYPTRAGIERAIASDLVVLSGRRSGMWHVRQLSVAVKGIRASRGFRPDFLPVRHSEKVGEKRPNPLVSGADER